MSSSIDSVRIHFDSDALWLLNICLAIIMFGVALDLKVADFKRVIYQPKSTLLGIFSQFLVLPFFTYLLILVIEPLPSIALGMILVASCPGGNISNFMTHLSGGNSALSVTLTAFSTLMAVFMTPLNLSLWAGLYPPTAEILKQVALDPFTLFKTIALILGLPLIAGMAFNHYNPQIAQKISKGLKPLSILIFLAFVVIAFAQNFGIFLEYIHMVVFIVFLHNVIGLSTGFVIGKLGGTDFEDQKSLAIETGIQNSGLGLVLIFAFFDGLGGMTIIAAWWGIWHIISGLALALYWGRRSTIVQPV